MLTLLVIDGGGIRGLLPSLVLERLAQLTDQRFTARGQPPQPLARLFDLIAGTSTGAIVAAGLGGTCDRHTQAPLLTPTQLVAFYRTQGTEVFAPSVWRHARGVLGCKYNPRPLERLFEHVFGASTLQTAATRLLIPAYDTERRSVRIFTGRPAAYRPGGVDYLLRDVLRATTAAPSLFPPARIAAVGTTRLETLIDGGVYANNPALFAYTEARKSYGDDTDLLLLSLGTGSDHTPYPYTRISLWGYSGWFNPRYRVPLLDIMMQGQSASVDAQLRQILVTPQRYFRFNVNLPAGPSALDDTSPAHLARLTALAEQLIEQRSAELALVADMLVETTVARAAKRGQS